MKIAVCISGQPRTWRTAKDNILSYFDLPEHQVDFFIHTWDKNNFRYKNEKNWDRKYIAVDKNELEEIQNTFKPKSIVMEEYIEEKFMSIWSSIYNSFMKSVWLKRKYELENDFIYDIVIKTRFDINFMMEGTNEKGGPINKFFVHNVKPLYGYSSNNTIPKFHIEYNYNTFDDVFFYSDSATMDIISNIYYWYKDIDNLSRKQIEKKEFVTHPEKYLGPGTILYRYLVRWGIHPYGEVFTPYYVVRKEAEDLNLHSVNDWNKIKDISNEWYSSLLNL